MKLNIWRQANAGSEGTLERYEDAEIYVPRLCAAAQPARLGVAERPPDV